jgi:hypothetical protein
LCIMHIEWSKNEEGRMGERVREGKRREGIIGEKENG